MLDLLFRLAALPALRTGFGRPSPSLAMEA